MDTHTGVFAVEEIESPGFEEILAEAIEKLQHMDPGWTNYNPADSGMLLLELFAFMTEAQQFYLSQLGTSHYLAFLHLMGAHPERMKPARTYAKAEGMGFACLLPRGFKVRAGEIVFEAEQEVYLEHEHILATELRGSVYPFGEDGRGVYEIPLCQGLDGTVSHSLYFEVDDDYPVARNPVDPEVFVPLVNLRMEYYDGTCYRNCRIQTDSTFGLLQTGIVVFGIGEETDRDAPEDNRYRLRLFAEGEYDTVPLLKEISFHVIPFVQKDTQIEYREYVLSPVTRGPYVVSGDSWLARRGVTEAYRKTDRGYQKITAFSTHISRGKRYFVFGKDCFSGQKEPVVCLVSSLPDLSGQNFVFEGNGLPGQQFFLPDSGVLSDDFLLWVEERPGIYIPWNAITDFAAAGKEERGYVLDEKKGILRFGNGRQGIMPKGKIKIVSYAVCAGSNGNIQRGQIGSAGAAGFYNPLPAYGGREPETAEECLKRCLDNGQTVQRAVTAGDYEEAIRQTPGLRIRNVKVFHSEERTNGLDVVIQPYTNGHRMMRSRVYDRNILRMLEKKKLLGTSIRIKKPEYIRVALQLEVLVKSRYAGAEERIREHIQKYFEESMDFGKTIVYGRVFGYIDTLPETAGVRALEIHAGGRGVERDENRDIHIPFHGMPYLDEMEIRYIWTDEG